MERNVVLFGKFLELFLGGLNVFFASCRFSQSDNRIAIVRGLLEDFKRFLCLRRRSVLWPDNNGRAVFDFERSLESSSLAFAKNAAARSGAPSSCHIAPILSNASAFCGSSCSHVEVAQLGFVVVAGFEIIVGLGKKARLLGFLGAGGD